MKKFSAIACSLIISCFTFLTIARAQTVVPFYIIIGQSNTGWANLSGINPQQAFQFAGPTPNTNMWNPGVAGYSTTWQPMNVGVNTQCENYADPTQFGFEASFIRSLQSRSPAKRFVYKQGEGGTTLASDWRPNGPNQQLYEAGPRWQQFAQWLPKAVAQADAQGYKLDLRAIIWMQGEDDAKTIADATAYQANLTKFFAALNTFWKGMVSGYGLPNTNYKKVIGRIYAPNGYPYRDLVRSAQYDFCGNSENNAIMINTDSYPLQDWVHFNATGQIQFGLDIFNAADYEGAAAAPSQMYFGGKVFLQGAYNASTGLMSNTLNTSGVLQAHVATNPYLGSVFNHTGNESVAPGFFAAHPEIVDWVLIEVRSSTSPSTVVSRRAAFVQRNGTLVSAADGTSTNIPISGITPGKYFVSIRHRNHLGVRSSQEVDFSTGFGQYDFTTSAAKSYQILNYPATVLTGSVWAMRGGNANLNNNVKYNGPLNDQDRIQNIALGGSLSGVVNSVYSYDDINMDGNVRTNGPNNDQNFLLNQVFFGFIGTVFTEQL